MKKRSILVCVLLSLVTCGLYDIYWMIVMNNELNEATNKQNATSGAVAFLFSLITCGIYSLYWFYKMGENVDIIRTRAGIPSANHGILYLIIGLFGFGIVNFCLMQDTLNKHVAA